MPRTQTTGVVISIAARATMARTELKGLRKDVAEFGNFVRETFRGASATKIKGPTLGGEWRAVQREIHDITTSIEKDINRIAALRLRAPTVGTFLRNSQTNAAAAVGAAAVTGGAAGAASKVSRAEEIEQAARLTREFHAGTLEAAAYRAELQKIADTAVKGSEKEIDALTRIKRVREQETATAERERNAEKKRQEQTAANAKRDAETARRQQFGTPFTGGRVAAGAGIARTVGDAMTVGVSLPIVATFAAATKSAMGFETAMRNVNSIAQLSEKDFQGLYQSVLKVAADPSIKQGPEELAKGLYELESSGFHGQKALELLAVSSKGATAGLSTTKTASEVLIGVLNSGIPGVTSAQQAMDVLFKTVDLGKVNFTELSVNLGKVLPTAAKAGITLQQLTGAIAAMTIQGASAAQASTGLLNLINKIANPSKVAEKEFRRLGVSYGYVGLQAKGLPGILEEINRKTGGHGDSIKRLLPDMRAQRAALQLINGDVKKYVDFTGEMNHANDGIGATQKALNEQTKALSFQWEKLQQRFQIIAAQIGPSLLRVLAQVLHAAEPLLKQIGDLADAFVKLTPEQQKWVLGLIAAAAAIGPLLSGIGRFAGGANDLIRLFQTLSPLIGSTGTAVAGLGTTAAAATGEVTALAAALTALSALGIITVGVIATIAAYKYIGKPLADAVGGLMDQDQDRKNRGTAVSDAQKAANKYRPFAVGGQAVDENTKGDIYQAYDRQRRALPMANGVVDWTAAAKDLYGAADKLSKLVLKPDNKLIARMRDQREIDQRYNADKSAADREALAKALNPGVVQPAGAGGGTGTKFHVTRPHVPRADTINAGAVVNDLTDQYGTAFGKYSDRSDRMSAGDRKAAEQGLMVLANRIQVAQQAEAKAAEDRVNLTSKQNREEAAKAKAAATTQAEAQRAEDMIVAADAADADAAATYTAAMKRIRNEHSERYRKIYANQEKTAEQLAEEAAKDQEQALQLEASKHDERIAAIDEQLKTTQDTTDRQKLLNEKYDEMDAAAKARYDAAKKVAGAIDNPREQKRALTQAGADYTASSNDIARQRAAAGLENDQQRIENEIRLHQIAADNTDDLIVKYRELKAVQDANIDLMKSQGAPQLLIEAQKAANAREQRAGQAEIAHGNAQTAFVQAATSGVGSFASGGDTGAEGLRKQLRGFFESEFSNTEQSSKGKIANEQFDTIVKAVQSNAVSLEDMLPLIRDVETRINASGSIDAAGNFARAFKSFFSNELADTFQKYDNEKSKSERAAQYNQLIAGIKSGKKFAGLSEGERGALVKTVEEKRDKRPDSDGKHHSYQQIGDEAAKAISESANRHSGEFVAGLFGDTKKAKAAAEDFWKEVAETGRKSLARSADEALLKPLSKRITAGLANVFQNGAGGFEGVLGRATASLSNVFKSGVAGIAQAAVYLQGVMALAGQGGGGRRGKKGSMIGMALGLGLGIATGGTGFALMGAAMTGASAGSQAAQGNYLGAALSVGTGFMPGGSFAGAPGPTINQFGGVGNQPYGPPVPKALGGGVSRGMHYQVNEDRAWIGKEAFIPSVDGMILPSATAISRLPTVAAANNSLLSELRDMIHGGGPGGKSPNFTLNNYGDQYTEADSDRVFRSWGRNVRDKMTRR